MSGAGIAQWVLLGIGMAAFLLTAIGLVVMKNVYDRIQFTYPATAIGVVAIVAAIVMERSLSGAGIKAILTGLLLFWLSPLLSHAAARAARVRSLGTWLPTEKEKIATAEDGGK